MCNGSCQPERNDNVYAFDDSNGPQPTILPLSSVATTIDKDCRQSSYNGNPFLSLISPLIVLVRATWPVIESTTTTPTTPVSKIITTTSPTLLYSYLNASTGFNLLACLAGSKPLSAPTTKLNNNAPMIRYTGNAAYNVPAPNA